LILNALDSLNKMKQFDRAIDKIVNSSNAEGMRILINRGILSVEELVARHGVDDAIALFEDAEDDFEQFREIFRSLQLERDKKNIEMGGEAEYFENDTGEDDSDGDGPQLVPRPISLQSLNLLQKVSRK
jgi:hypothetical protein